MRLYCDNWENISKIQPLPLPLQRWAIAQFVTYLEFLILLLYKYKITFESLYCDTNMNDAVAIGKMPSANTRG